jgi:hypothetical protein
MEARKGGAIHHSGPSHFFFGARRHNSAEAS